MGRSGVIPGWKVRRELNRFAQQLRAVPEAFWEPFARRTHDAALAKGFPVFEGAQPETAKIALVLCWQPRGAEASFLLMLDHLIDNGYAPLVVSNAPLSEADHMALRPRFWRAVVRPNFGYDFGGYRDGLALLRRWGVRPDRLVILNDSIWFPLWSSDKTLQRAEAAPEDVVGSILRQRGSTAFLESYFFSIRGPVLDHPGFRAFWDGLHLTSNKYKVIRLGERGFGLALTAAGISMGPLFPQAAFESALHDADDPALRQFLWYMAATDPAEAAEGARHAASSDTPDWPHAAREFIDRVLRKAQPYSAFLVAAARHLNYPFLKKSAEPVSFRWRAAFLRAVDDGILPLPPPDVLTEARARTIGGTR